MESPPLRIPLVLGVFVGNDQPKGRVGNWYYGATPVSQQPLCSYVAGDPVQVDEVYRLYYVNYTCMLIYTAHVWRETMGGHGPHKSN